MKKTIEYPDWVEKYRTPGHTIRKTKSGYGLYRCTSTYVKGGYPKSVQTYLGMIKPDGFVPKSVVSKHPLYVEYALSRLIMQNFKRSLMRSAYQATESLIKLGIIFYIFESIDKAFLASSYLTYNQVEELTSYVDKISARRIINIRNRIEKLLNDHFTEEEMKLVKYKLLLCPVDINASSPVFPDLPMDIKSVIERKGLIYERN